MSRVAIATTSAIVDPDLEVLAHALGACGIEAVAVSWDADGIDWSAMDLTVIRSTWDYAPRVGEFLEWCASVPRLCNPAEVVRWNADKRYLAELSSRGVAVIETAYATSGGDAVLPDGAVVVKPSVGAGSRGAKRFAADAHDAARAHVDDLSALGLVAMVQPYLEGIERGETAVVVLDGEVSHAVTKFAPMGLDATAVPAGPIAVEPATPTPDQRAVVDAALAALPWPAPCYARVDLVATDAGPVVLEVELIEPYLFLATDDAAADRLAAAIARRVGPHAR